MRKNFIFLIAGVALFIAIAQMPYGYYQLLRWFICGVGAYGAYLSYEQKKMKWVWILGIIALVFNPFFKFYFTKETWVIIDLVAGILFCIFFGTKNK
jgi:hypothetical protein